MRQLIRLCAVIFAILVTSPAQSEDISLDAPAVLLDNVQATVVVNGGDSNSALAVLLNGAKLPLEFDGSVHRAQITLIQTDTATIELRHGEAIIEELRIPVIPAWVSLLPPLIAVLLSFALRSVIPSLFAGLIVGAWAINGLTFEGAIVGIFDTMSIYILDAMTDPDHGSIILFSLLIGGMVGIVSRNGGMLGIVNRVIPIAKTPRRGQAVIASLGLAIFFDDYANTMIVGNATRPVSDKLRISREKLAYLVDSTAAPVATIAIITTWIGFQVGLIEEAMVGLEGIDQPAYGLFLQSIPYSFYPFLAIFFVYVVVWTGKDFGPMHTAEVRARTTGAVTREGSTQSSDRQMEDFQEKDGIPCLAINALVPIGCLVLGVVGGMYISGDGDTLQEIVGSANAYLVLIWASLLACMAAFILSLAQRLLTLNELVDAWVVGARFMLTGLLLLVMAWAIADVTNILQTAPYLISVLGDSLSPYSLPAVVFLLAAAAGFASGSSWGVMAILMPLVIPLCWAVLQSNGIADAQHMHILYSCIACVLTGAVWSDHCSPISDTTVLSSLATGCDHMDHVATQLPYAMLGGVAALLLCTLPAGYGLPWWLLLPTAAVAMFAAHRFLAKPITEEMIAPGTASDT